MSSGDAHPHVTLRRASDADVAAIAEIEHRSFTTPVERFGPKKVRYLITSPRTIVIVAQEEGRVLGWAAGFSRTGANHWGRVYAIAVHPDARRRKLGPRLLHEIVSLLHTRGAAQIFLEVRADNHPAIRLYERFGFTRCKALREYYGKGIDGWRMVLRPEKRD